jgi:hypothetical protein
MILVDYASDAEQEVETNIEITIADKDKAAVISKTNSNNEATFANSNVENFPENSELKNNVIPVEIPPYQADWSLNPETVRTVKHHLEAKNLHGFNLTNVIFL